MGKRRKYTDEFKREAVRLMETRGERTVGDVAESLGVAENLLHSPGYAAECGRIFAPGHVRRQEASVLGSPGLSSSLPGEPVARNVAAR